MFAPILITGPSPKAKKTPTPIADLGQQMLVNTADLQRLLGVGRPAAVEIGNAANAKVCIGRKILWNTAVIRKHLDSIADDQRPVLLRR